MIQLLINGARGRMGSRIAALAREDERFSVAAELDRDDPLPEPSPPCDLVIDFSTDEGTRSAAQLAAAQGSALLVGTTGLAAPTVASLESLADSVAVMIAPNTSLGVAVLNHLLREAARLLPHFDVDLTDAHHAAKRDAPSGTALRLLRTLAEARGSQLPAERVHCIRAGDIIGDHAIQFAGPGERITLAHSATSRDLFARGALHAGAWLAGRAPGLYAIEDSLGLGPAAPDHLRGRGSE